MSAPDLNRRYDQLEKIVSEVAGLDAEFASQRSVIEHYSDLLLFQVDLPSDPLQQICFLMRLTGLWDPLDIGCTFPEP